MLEEAALDAELVLPERTAELVLPERTAELVLPERTAELALPERTAELALPERMAELLAERTAELTDAVRAVVLPATSEPALLTWVMVPRDEALVVVAVRDATSAVRLMALLVVPIPSALDTLLTVFPLTVPLGLALMWRGQP